ncbi:Concanavalin A-like lectin/glucanases superfamily protein [uncultured archaeon]|nr:Concanavalin A-like lectin/glucanases superfamily protein [uncultured archaeon]
MISWKSQGGYEYLLIAGSVILFFLLSFSFVYHVINYNSGQPTVSASNSNTYNSRGVDCYSQKIVLNWNDAQVQDCLTNYLVVAQAKQNCTAYGVLDYSKIRAYYAFTNGFSNDTLGLSTQVDSVNPNTTVGFPVTDTGQTFGGVDYIPAPNTDGFHITSFKNNPDWNGDFAFSMWIYFLSDADISIYNSTQSSFGNSAAYIKYASNVVSFGTKTNNLIQYGPVSGWFHFMVTNVNSNLSLYINGSLVNSTVFNGGFGSITGMQLWRGNNFGGVLDEIKFYSGTILPSIASYEYMCIRSQDA